MGTAYKLTYFNSRGLAEPARFAFAYAGVPYEDIRFEHGSSDWTEKKSSFPWRTIPVLEFDGQILSQSKTILRYLGNKLNLAGENEFETAKCDEFLETMSDLEAAIYALPFGEVDEVKRAELAVKIKTETFPKFLNGWNEAIKINGGFLVGKKFSIADFCIASYLDIFNEPFGGDLLDGYPFLKAHLDSVFSAKGIKEWVEKRPKTQF